MNLIIGGVVLLFHWFYFPRMCLYVMAMFGFAHFNQNTNFYNIRIVLTSVLLCCISLWADNFFVWHVQYIAKDSWEIPLYDYGRAQALAFWRYFLKDEEMQPFRHRIDTQWLVLWLTIADFIQNTRTRWRKMSRILITIGIMRFIRISIYTLTIIPSQIPNCQARRFGELPTDWFNWFIKGAFEARGHGGCHDLLVSGHATIITTLAWACTSGTKSFLLCVEEQRECQERTQERTQERVSRENPIQPIRHIRRATAISSTFILLFHTCIKTFHSFIHYRISTIVTLTSSSNLLVGSTLWLFVFMDFMFEIIGQTHYSIDIWVGFLLTSFVWRETNNIPKISEIIQPVTQTWGITYIIPLFFSLGLMWPSAGVFICLIGLFFSSWCIYSKKLKLAELTLFCMAIFGSATFI